MNGKNILLYLLVIMLFPVYVFSQQMFSDEKIIEWTEISSAGWEARTFDIDNDGDLDIGPVRSDDRIVWLENFDGQGHFKAQKIITNDGEDVFLEYLTDLDSDGDLDLVTVAYDEENKDDNLYLFINNDGDYVAKKFMIDDATAVQSIAFNDLDGDGDLDIAATEYSYLSRYDDTNQIVWYEHLDGKGSFGSKQVIASWIISFAFHPQLIYAVDIDSDGDNDLVCSSEYYNEFVWCENTNGSGSFSTHWISLPYSHGHDIRYLLPADLDKDDDTDLLLGLYHKVVWLKNEGGSGSFSPMITISESAENLNNVFAGDVDGDGDLDAISSSCTSFSKKIAWYENTDGAGTFGNQQVISEYVDYGEFVWLDDLNGDNKPDLLRNDHGDIRWHQNTDGAGAFSESILISNQMTRPHAACASDLNNDGYKEILVAAYGSDEILWYENLNRSGEFGLQQTITHDCNGPEDICLADLDGDGIADLLSAEYFYDKIAWYKNEGENIFGAQQIISDETDGATAVCTADLDGDSDIDVISASEKDDKIAWYVNSDGNGSFGPQQLIGTSIKGDISIYPVDLNGDDNVDILYSSEWDDKIAWFENTDGLGSFDSEHVISETEEDAQSVNAADLDGDDDKDILCVSLDKSTDENDQIVWYENTDGNGSFGQKQLITTFAGRAAFMCIHTCDLDGDGDTDALSASSADAQIAWHENLNGDGKLWTQHIIKNNAINANFVFTSDLNNDGAQDVIFTTNNGKIAWFENSLEIDVPPTIVKEPNNFKISPNYPNPFNPTTTISFSVKQKSPVTLNIYDITGRRVKTLVDKTMNPDNYTVKFDGTNLPSGIYFYQIKMGGFQEARKMTLLK